MLLLCYDGSEDSEAAIDAAAELYPGSPATILTIWEPFAALIARATFGPGYIGDVGEFDKDSEQAADKRAAEGVARANAAGLEATALSAPLVSTVAQAIVTEGTKLDAKVIVLGTRGLSGVKSVFLGSVSHAVLQHADRPVTVAPSAAVVETRSKHHH